MMKLNIILLALTFTSQLNAQDIIHPDSAKQKYLADLKILGRHFTEDFYPNYNE